MTKKSSKKPSVSDILADKYPEAFKMDGYDDCIIGICCRLGQPPIIAYDYHKVIRKLMRNGMKKEEALEWFEYNIGAWMGDTTPCFIEKLQ